MRELILQLSHLLAESTNSDKLFYKRLARHYLCDLMKPDREVKLTCAAYHRETHILITGFSNGSFLVHELPEVNHIHSLRYVCCVTTCQTPLLCICYAVVYYFQLQKPPLICGLFSYPNCCHLLYVLGWQSRLCEPCWKCVPP
jgi:hypothetical protein